MVNTVTDAIANHPAAALNLLNSGTTQVLNQSSQLFDTTFHQTWDGGLSSWWATEQKSDKDIGIWWNSGGSTQVIGIFFPEIYAINTLQEWGRGRQPQLSDALSFIPVAGYAGQALDAVGSLGQSESAIADVAANDVAETDSAVADASDSAAGATCSFSADTQVATDKGEQAISSLKVGDHVLAYDPETTKIALKAIDAVLKHIDLSLEDLTIDGEVIHTTPNHPFYTQDKGWVTADNLTVGESILKADGSYSKVQSVRLIDHAQGMYNLTVHDDHDYFVGIGQWLVHNECPPTKGSGSNIVGSGRIYIHGTDLNSLNDIIDNGLNVEKARAVGGGDKFWLLPPEALEQARWFARSAPGTSVESGPAILGIELPYDNIQLQNMIRVDPDSKWLYVLPRSWDTFNSIARFFRFE